jgi:intracellular septation protein A
VDGSRDTQPATTSSPAAASRRPGSPGQVAARFRSVAMIAVFDIGAPLAAYNLIRSAGLSAVTALVLSGVFPAVGLAARALMHRRVDVVGAVVLGGIVVGAVVGLITHNARFVLLEGSVPTAVFGLACLGSLRARRPLMFSIALEFNGPDTDRGRWMTSLWRHEEFRRLFRVITAVWGISFLVEAALRVVIVYSTSTSTALGLSKVTPFIWAGIMSAWTLAYGAYHKKKGEQRMAAAGPDADRQEAEQTAAPAVLESPNSQL